MFRHHPFFAAWPGACILAFAGCDDSKTSTNSAASSEEAAMPVEDAAASGTRSEISGTESAVGSDSNSASTGYPLGTGEDDHGNSGAHLFDTRRVATLVIEVTDSGLEQLRTDADQPMGLDNFTYVPARITYDGVVLDEVGIRVKGNSSRASAVGNAVPFKLDINRYVPDQKLDGETKVNLHNNANQPSLMNEFLSYGALRDFGMAASRTGWVDVTLNGEALGTYVTVEQVGDKLLSRYYEDGDADLYKPEPPTGYLTYSGADFDSYPTANYDAKNDTDHAMFLKLVETINQRDVSEWGEVIDVDSVLNYFAANVGLGNWDTYVAMGHNYYLFEATPGRMVILPWDMNLSQAATSAVCPRDLMGQGTLPSGEAGEPGSGGVPGGGFPGAGGMLPLGLDAGALDGGIFVPPEGIDVPLFDGGMPSGAFGMGGEAPLHDRLLADPTYLALYLKRLQEFLNGPGSRESLEERIEMGAAALGQRVTDQAVEKLREDVSARVTNLSAAIGSTTSCNTSPADSGGLAGELPQ